MSFRFTAMAMPLATLLSVAAPTAAANSGVLDKVMVGYQGWFNAEGDGSSVGWRHWAGSEPSPGNQSFELYPDVREYPAASVFATGYASLGGGEPSRLFSSYSPGVTDVHFRWMKEYGIDGAALQRFGCELEGQNLVNRNAVTTNARRAAEKYQRLFYVMYDISGMHDDGWAQKLKADWSGVISAQLKLTSSPMYAKEGGKPVVSLWGIGFTDNHPGTAQESIDLIRWFKAKGCYVIGGVPTNWRTSTGDSKPGFKDVYAAYDMVSPWTVGRFSSAAQADDFKKNYLVPDLEYCRQTGLAYQPVIFPGFAWSNWNGGSANAIARKRGDFLWRQAYNLRSLGIPRGYIAMFDEYDEGTAIAKAAEDSWAAPTDQYFLTTSADGTFLSSDFYLRLAGAATRMIRGVDPLSATPLVPPTVGPVHFRSSFEPADAKPVSRFKATVLKTQGMGADGGKLLCSAVKGEQAKWGDFSMKVTGNAPPSPSPAPAFVYQKAIEVSIPVKASTRLAFSFMPMGQLGQHVALDLMTTDGLLLSEAGAVDGGGQSLKPSSARGVVGKWTETRVDVGRWLQGKTVAQILVTFEGPGASGSGDFSAYFDDIVVSEREEDLTRK